MIIHALKWGVNIMVITKNKSKILSVEQLRKNGKLLDLVNFFSTYAVTKNKFLIKIEAEKLKAYLTQSRSR